MKRKWLQPIILSMSGETKMVSFNDLCFIIAQNYKPPYGSDEYLLKKSIWKINKVTNGSDEYLLKKSI